MRVPSRRLHGILLIACAGAAAGQTAPIGLSEIRGQLLELPASASIDPQQFGFSTAVGDFNGDGVDDLAVGSPTGSNSEECLHGPCGLVAVRYGMLGGWVGNPSFAILGEDLGSSDHNERYGWALASGDFDHDGYDDLAVGIPWNAPAERGGVRVHYGSASGLETSMAHFLSEATAGEPTHWCDETYFGKALAAGDFDGDSFDDLAVGAPEGCDRLPGGEPVAGGSVFVFHGKSTGLLPFYGYRMSQSSFGIDPVEDGDHFGAALAAGDFDADSFADLAVGIPHESGHGALEIVMGSQFGLIFADSAFWAPGALGETPEIGDALGWALASGDFDGDGHDDLAVGNPYERLPDPGPPTSSPGKIDVAYGSPAGFDLGRTDRVTQGELYGDPLQDGGGDFFGNSFAAGDFDGDGFADLAVGHPEDSWSGSNHGAVSVLMGSAGGVAASARFRYLTTGFEGLPGSATQAIQRVGSSLAAGDFDGNGFADLAIGVAGYAGPNLTSGAVVVLYGALFADGFELGGPERWSSWQP